MTVLRKLPRIESTIKNHVRTFPSITAMKPANETEKLEMHIFKSKNENMERATSQSISVPIIHYDHEPRSLSRPFEKMEYTLLQKSQQLFNSEMVTFLLLLTAYDFSLKNDLAKFAEIKSLSEKDDAKENSGPVLVGNEGPSIIVKATVCVIAFIIMVICFSFKNTEKHVEYTHKEHDNGNQEGKYSKTNLKTTMN
ncbi:hypothetical protein DINM_022085 [Dirofilaria immitis]|nr:hypothetical protein [Dirofilaria immitis]